MTLLKIIKKFNDDKYNRVEICNVKHKKSSKFLIKKLFKKIYRNVKKNMRINPYLPKPGLSVL